MSEMDEKLNTLLSDPGSMARIMQLAQQLSGTMGGAEKSTPEPPPPPPAGPEDQTGGGTAGFGGLGGLDPALLGKLLPLAQEYGRSNSASMQLLNALRPFLKPEKQGKVERAAHLASAWVTELTECFRLDLTDTLSCYIKLSSNLFKCTCSSVIHSETKTEDFLLSLCQCIQHFIQLLFQKCLCSCLCRNRYIIILDKVSKVAVFLFTDWCLKRNRFL